MNNAAARRNREKGAEAERAVASYLRDEGFPEARRNVDRRVDTGDLLGVGHAGLEVKAQRRFDLAGWLMQANKGCAEAGLSWPVVVVKPPGIGLDRVARWYAVTDLETLVALLREAS